MLKNQKLLSTASIVLCILLASPQIWGATTTNTTVSTVSADVVNVQTSNCVKTIKAFNMEFPAREKIRVETFRDGTRKATISVNITSKDRTCGVCITAEVMLPTKTSEISEAVTPSVPSMSGVYPYKNCSASTDWLLFLLKGQNGTHLVSYNHDDNYDTYYPQWWYHRYSLPDANYPEPRAKQVHVHLAKDYIDNWINQVIDDATMHGIILSLAAGGTELSFALIALYLGLQTFGAALVLIIPMLLGGLADILAAYLQLQGLQKAKWIRDVVTEKFSGDGWTWMWGFNIIHVSKPYIMHPPIGDIYTYEQLYRLLQYRRMHVLYRKTLEYYKSWGADRDNPIKYTAEAWDLEIENPGIIATSADDYRTYPTWDPTWP